MSNMTYCRFENTLGDLQDCFENMDSKEYSPTEQNARRQLIDLCVDIALDYGVEIEREVEKTE